MAILSIPFPPLTNTPSSSSSSSKLSLCRQSNIPTLVSFSSLNSRPLHHHHHHHHYHHHAILWSHITAAYRFTTRGGFIDEEEDHHASVDNSSFTEAVKLFNGGEYYKCHDVLEALWNKSQEPVRTLVHGILQCAVGFHHLFNQNHRGAMMELGEGLCKLRKLNFESGPFHEFEQEISAVLNFIYQTQLELAACTDEVCLTMDRSERSYQLLGGYAAGQQLYHLESDENKNTYILFCPKNLMSTSQQLKIKVPVLQASEEHLTELEYN